MSTEQKIKFIELNYHCHLDMNIPEQVISKHLPSNLFATKFKDFASIKLVKHLNYEGSLEKEGIDYRFFRRSNWFTQVPSRTHQFVKQAGPDLLLVQGFIFPIQVIFLRRMLGKKPIILLQHHGERPVGKRKHFQRIADRYADGYLFSSLGNADEWLQSKVIKNQAKCFELPSSSTKFCKQEKTLSRQYLGMKEGLHFLWVGRLNANKDPLTVLKAFEKYAELNGVARLWMLFGEDDMLAEIKDFISQSEILKEKTHLAGKRPHAELETWFSAADYYISSSHREGGSYALTEAMACGCIPIVTTIPASMNAVDNGRIGYYFEQGNSDSLLDVLKSLDNSKQIEMSGKVLQRFKEHFSAESIAQKLFIIHETLRKKRNAD